MSHQSVIRQYAYNTLYSPLCCYSLLDIIRTIGTGVVLIYSYKDWLIQLDLMAFHSDNCEKWYQTKIEALDENMMIYHFWLIASSFSVTKATHCLIQHHFPIAAVLPTGLGLRVVLTTFNMTANWQTQWATRVKKHQKIICKGSFR